jgi:hypothetical protein
LVFKEFDGAEDVAELFARASHSIEGLSQFSLTDPVRMAHRLILHLTAGQRQLRATEP